MMTNKSLPGGSPQITIKWWGCLLIAFACGLAFGLGRWLVGVAL